MAKPRLDHDAVPAIVRRAGEEVLPLGFRRPGNLAHQIDNATRAFALSTYPSAALRTQRAAGRAQPSAHQEQICR
jgi:hypothetical protein